MTHTANNRHLILIGLVQTGDSCSPVWARTTGHNGIYGSVFFSSSGSTDMEQINKQFLYVSMFRLMPTDVFCVEKSARSAWTAIYVVVVFSRAGTGIPGLFSPAGIPGDCKFPAGEN